MGMKTNISEQTFTTTLSIYEKSFRALHAHGSHLQVFSPIYSDQSSSQDCVDRLCLIDISLMTQSRLKITSHWILWVTGWDTFASIRKLKSQRSLHHNVQLDLTLRCKIVRLSSVQLVWERGWEVTSQTVNIVVVFFACTAWQNNTSRKGEAMLLSCSECKDRDRGSAEGLINTV